MREWEEKREGWKNRKKIWPQIYFIFLASSNTILITFFWIKLTSLSSKCIILWQPENLQPVGIYLFSFFPTLISFPTPHNLKDSLLGFWCPLLQQLLFLPQAKNSPISVINVCKWHCSKTWCKSSSVCCCWGSRFSRSVPLNKKGSWGIIANLDLKIRQQEIIESTQLIY